MGLRILSTGISLPKTAVSNDRLATMMNTSDQWISSRTGIKYRHIASGDENLTSLSIAAAGTAIERAAIRVSDIDMIICSTMCGDYVFPSLACCVAEALGVTCPAFDLNAACSGFIYALDIADKFISTGRSKHILIVCAEMMSRLCDWTDRSTCVLFGDGAAACVVGEGNAIKYINLTSDGHTHLLYQQVGSGNSPFRPQKEPGFLVMAGQDVFKFAVSKVGQQTELALQALNLTPDDIDLYILHQANKRIIDSARARLEQPEEKFPTNIDRYGNTSSVTIPLLLDELLEAGSIKKGTKLLLSAFGAGMTTGTCVMIWE
ncbi:MAG TPA: ketoacyl-ACP synthase III [Clostridiales bacterium]|jgi:3-oxoacyl-[acyl-carrier-protein] synthase-3|nr:ketoacyl-ACP synthase III [Clostridiales bacterium]